MVNLKANLLQIVNYKIKIVCTLLTAISLLCFETSNWMSQCFLLCHDFNALLSGRCLFRVIFEDLFHLVYRVEKEAPSQKKVTPGKKRRSERVIAGRSHSRTPRSTHKSISRRLLSRIKARHIDFNVDSDEEIQEPSAPELSQRYSLLAQPIRGLKPQGSSMPSASASKQPLDENRASALKTLDQSEKTENLSKGARQPQKAAEELVWVEIPPPREEPMDEDYLLDDLTSLDFGPILALEHGVRVDLQDQDEHEIGDPTLGPLALSDFSTNLAF